MKPIKTWPSGKRLPKFKNNIKKLEIANLTSSSIVSLSPMSLAFYEAL